MTSEAGGSRLKRWKKPLTVVFFLVLIALFTLLARRIDWSEALRTLQTIASAVKAKYALVGIAITHRLGNVGIGEESVHIAVSSPHRKSAWEAGEEALEEVKKKAEIWKMEVFEDGGVWRSNRDGEQGVRVDASSCASTS